TEYYVYDYQGNRVRTVLESKQTIQSQRNYLPSLDISTNENNQPTNTLHIGTHILSEITKNNAQTRYQLASHLQSNTLELNDKADIISYEHYYPYGGTALIAGKDQTQVRQKRYRYTDKERDDSSGLSYYGARYLAPWMARWISPDSAGTATGLNLYVYVGNNPLKYTDPTGHVKETPEQEAMEEGAVGGVAETPDSGKHTAIDKNITPVDLSQVRSMKQEILQWDVFKKLGELDSSSRFFDEGGITHPMLIVTAKKIQMLRDEMGVSVRGIREKTGASVLNAVIQFAASNELEHMVFNKHQVANCAECGGIMLNVLNRHYHDMPVELLETPDHVFNLLNRNQSTPLLEPNKWNDDTLVVDAWNKNIHIKGEFLPVIYSDSINNPKGQFFRILKHKDNIEGQKFAKDKPKSLLNRSNTQIQK
ncbi:MAG: RHS repeat-associated core domain-containing protein, partial [Gammaproteobacteria bacterium]|nr:RHS repeat-associated core domain-containing protein [Gammaproteobacteria bacterium]